MSSLPGILGDIADIAGPEAALAIAREVGGIRVDFPAEVPDDHWLTDVVGLEVAQKICKGLASLSPEGRRRGVYHEVVPLGPTSVLRNARRKASTALAAGRSVREAARLAGLHERTVFRMKASDDDDQGNLF